MSPSPPRPFLRRKSVVVAAACILGILVLALPFLCTERGLYCCTACGTVRSLSGWGLAFRSGEDPLLWIHEGEDLEETKALADLLPSSHLHVWRLRSYRWRGILPAFSGPAVDGGGYRTVFQRGYESSSALRDRVLGDIRTGGLSREDARGMLALPNLSAGDAPGERDLRLRACALMEECGAGDAGVFAPEAAPR